MAFIKCPQCGHTALSVASTCPSCGELLVQNRMQQGERSDIIECRRCEKQIHRHEAICPYCGYRTHRWHAVRAVAWSVFGVALVGAGIVLVMVMRQAESVPTAQAESPGSPAPSVEVASPQPELVPSPAPERATPLTATAPAPRAAAVAPPPPANTRPRWTANWVNVRETPGTSGTVVRVLQPGTPVHVGQFRSGWWAVYLDGALLGWAAGDLLDTTPPGTLP